MMTQLSFVLFSALIWTIGVAFLERETARDCVISSLITFVALFVGTYFLIFSFSVSGIEFFPYAALIWIVFSFSFIGFTLFLEFSKKSVIVYTLIVFSYLSALSLLLLVIHHSLISIVATTDGDLFAVVYFFTVIYCLFRFFLPFPFLKLA